MLVNNDIISIICEFFKNNIDTFNVSKLNKFIYSNKNQYGLYNVHYNSFNKLTNIGNKIIGLKCDKFNDDIFNCIKNNNLIQIELKEIKYPEFEKLIELSHTKNIEKIKIKEINCYKKSDLYPSQFYKFDIIFSKNLKCLKIKKIFDCDIIPHYPRIICLKNCTKLTNICLDVNEKTEIIFPNNFEDKLNKFIIYSADINDFKYFEYSYLVTEIHFYEIANYIELGIYLNSYKKLKKFKLKSCDLQRFNFLHSNPIKKNVKLDITILKLTNEMFDFSGIIEMPKELINFTLKVNNSHKPLILTHIPNGIKQLIFVQKQKINDKPLILNCTKLSNIIYVEKDTDIVNDVDYIYFFGRQVKFLVNGIKHLFFENCDSVDLTFYKNINKLILKNCSNIIGRDKLEVNEICEI